MTATFDKATIKIWFASQHTSRNIHNVIEIVQRGNTALIVTAEGNQFLISMQNVNMIEELPKK